MIRKYLTIIFFITSGILALIGVIVSLFGPHPGGLYSMMGIGYTISMFVAVFLSFQQTGLSVGALRKTPYYKYGSMEIERYDTASPTTCGCCLPPLMIFATLYLAGFESSPVVLVYYILAAIFGILGGIVAESPRSRESARFTIG